MFKVFAIKGSDLLDETKRAEWEKQLNEFEGKVDKAGLYTPGCAQTPCGDVVVASFFVSKKTIVENTPYGPRQFNPVAHPSDLASGEGEGRPVRGPRILS